MMKESKRKCLVMSEQFTKSKDNQIQQNGLIMSVDEVVDYLNTSNNAINSLQYENAQLQKENKQLKRRNDELEDELEESSTFIIEQRKENKTLKEENEQLRQKLDFYLLDEFEWKEKYGDCDE